MSAGIYEPCSSVGKKISKMLSIFILSRKHKNNVTVAITYSGQDNETNMILNIAINNLHSLSNDKKQSPQTT